MVFAFFCKAVATGEVTVVRDVETQRFYDGRTFLEVHDIIFILVRCK